MNTRFLLLSWLYTLISTALLGQNNNHTFQDFVSKNHNGFLENLGQIKQFDGQAATSVKFVLDRAENKIYFHEDKRISFQYNHIKNAAENKHSKEKHKLSKSELASEKKKTEIETYRMYLQLLGANPNSTIRTEGKSADFFHYFNYNIRDVHHYQKIIYDNVYPGIDWIVYTTENGFKYDFNLKAGADPSLIKIKFSFQDSLFINNQGQLIHSNHFVKFTEDKPVSYQNGKTINTAFKLSGDTLSFILEDYNKNEALTIDPDRIWSTYYGGINDDFARATSVDANGNVYLCGQTKSSTGISSPGAFQTIYTDSLDAFLVKFNRDGVRQWATYFGGIGDDFFTDMSIGPDGLLYLCGSTSTVSGIATVGQTIYGGNLSDAFLLKMDTFGVPIWTTYIGGEDLENLPYLSIDANSNIYVAGATYSTTNINNGGFQTSLIGFKDAFLFKFDANGLNQWSTYFGGNLGDELNDITIDKSNNIYLSGNTWSNNGLANSGQINFGGGTFDGYIAKISPNCQLIWSTYFGGDQVDIIYGITTDQNNNVYITGRTNSTNGSTFGFLNNIFSGDEAFLTKLDSAGVLQWAYYAGGSGYDLGLQIIANSDNLFLIGDTESTDLYVNGFQNNNEGFTDCFISKYDFNGNLKWSSYLGGENNEFTYGCALDNQNYLYICGRTLSSGNIGLNGYQNSNAGSTEAFLAKISTCSANITGNESLCLGKSTILSASSAATYVWSSGETTPSILVSPQSNTFYSVSTTDAFGCTASKSFSLSVRPRPVLSGQLVMDNNGNCSFDAGEKAIIGSMVELSNNNNSTYANVIDSTGFYQTVLDTGTTIIFPLSPNPYWRYCYAISITDSTCAAYNGNLLLDPFISCPLLKVDIATGLLRKTQSSNYFVNYCNEGTTLATNASVTVRIDTFLEIRSSSIPIQSQIGNELTFNVGNLQPGDCGNFSIEVIVKLNTFSRQTHCSYAEISPDSICLPNLWNGALIHSSANCSGDTVYFILENSGNSMLNRRSYSIYQDSFLILQDSFQLNNNQLFTIPVSADSGKCYRIIASQESGFPPILGDSTTTVFVENCNRAASPLISRGFGLQFSNGNSAPQKAVDCTENVSAYDPNDKRGQPFGYSSQFLIYDNTDLDYTVRFQNTGSDTAFNVVILDTISNYFDLSSIEMGASSHIYNWQIIDGNVLKVSFNNIKLPDSITNEVLSQGFFKYRIKQQLANPNGSQILNQAAIYFDFEPAIYTNTTLHRVGQDFDIPFTSVYTIPDANQLDIRIFPNPFTDYTEVQLLGSDLSELRILISDINGKIRQEIFSNENSFRIYRQNLNPGFYFIQIFKENRSVGIGKIIVH